MTTAQYHLGWRGRREDPDAPRFAEFFAGIGLVRMGLEAADWRLAFANDIDPEKRAMYDGHFKDAAEHLDPSDIHSLDPERVPDVHLATASFPCTDLSLAGARLGLDAGPQSSAFWGFVRVLRDLANRRPPLILLENVLGFLNSRGGQDFHAAMRSLNELGYCVDPFVLDARWFVPQSRPRLFVVGSMIADSDARQVALPSRTRPRRLCEATARHRDVDWRFRTLPEPPLNSDQSLEDIVDDLPSTAPEWWDDKRCAYLYNQFSERHQRLADALIVKRRWSYATVFRRVRPQTSGLKRSMGELRTDGIAGCLRTPKGGSGRQILFKAGYGRFSARLLTPEECARLMGADGFEISVPANQAFFGFGDAVCVPAISWIAHNYLNPLVHRVIRPALTT